MISQAEGWLVSVKNIVTGEYHTYPVVLWAAVPTNQGMGITAYYLDDGELKPAGRGSRFVRDGVGMPC
jgi:hypothetical protein